GRPLDGLPLRLRLGRLQRPGLQRPGRGPAQAGRWLAGRGRFTLVLRNAHIETEFLARETRFLNGPSSIILTIAGRYSYTLSVRVWSSRPARLLFFISQRRGRSVPNSRRHSTRGVLE